MAEKQKFSNFDKRAETLAAKTEQNKKLLVSQLRKTPIVQIACEKTNVGRSTYYEWRAEDRIFARAADGAIESGKFFVNDIAESQLIRMIQSGNLGAIIFWLKNNHPSYSNRVIHEYDITCERLSTEEKHAGLLMLSRAISKKITPRLTVDEIKEEIEQEEREEEENKKIDDKLKEYNEGFEGV